MAQNSQTKPQLDPREILEAQLRESYGRVVYSHKTHEKCADLLLTRLSRIKFWQITLSAIATAGFVTAVVGPTAVGSLVGLIVSTCLLALNAYTKDYDLGELAEKHRQTAAELWAIRERYLSLLTDLAMNEISLKEIRLERDRFIEDLQVAYGGAPSTTFQAYKKAQAALKRLDDMTFSDEEIDAFLPSQLHRA
ncbi:MAG: hypothetical protein A2Z21_01230 [Candidatus Fraserbacteria bacterium RBG_16_55_9]|uniref:SMODS and SLOG-associating 2TM effector domain-containing protein n=1 Tax=Fraserbacteria sp. (strain RBG_16_55_9) TaxID=1817864 RepID=A0A1F5UZN2_FRAXR|nr:MAG: hypothetical protein A2Z21_01230 [Candidatus Fraserbacteria bacterium RBG_16_55_9]